MYQIFIENASAFLEATVVTLKLTTVSLLLAMVIGLVIAFCKISKSRVLYSIAQLYITVIRGTPLIVQLMFLYFGIIKLVVLPAFWAGSLALAIHAGAYIAEIFRGAIQSISTGQMEAARSVGMSKTLAMRRIILPQAFKRAVPPLGNQFIIGLKDSSLVAYLGVSEIYGTALTEQAANFMPLETYLVAGMYYLVLVVIFTYLVNKLEIKLDVEKGGEVS
ncbi:MAG: amino acid ABC transporter permease [Syntrophaceticus sp.]